GRGGCANGGTVGAWVGTATAARAPTATVAASVAKVIRGIAILPRGIGCRQGSPFQVRQGRGNAGAIAASRSPGSVRLEARELDHLAPLLGVLFEQLAVFGG